MLSRRSIDVPDTPTHAGPYNSDAGRVGDPSHGSEVGEDMPERTTQMHTLCRETMARNTDRAGIFGDSFVDLKYQASRRRHGAERADPPTPRFRRGRRGTPRRRNRAQRRPEVGEIRRLETDRIRLRIITGIFIARVQSIRTLYVHKT